MRATCPVMLILLDFEYEDTGSCIEQFIIQFFWSYCNVNKDCVRLQDSELTFEIQRGERE
jgi:hypothetical protein